MRKLARLVAFLLLPLALLAAAGCGGRHATTRLRLATTTSTQNSGLLEWLLPPFEKKSGIEVDVVAVGTGAALKLGEEGDADIVLVHARSQEDRFVAEGWGIDRHDVMWNDFVILGPPSDPAKLQGMSDAAKALQQIARSKATFVSRGDNSGTHTKEKALWAAGGGRPAWDGYLEAGQGMGACLTMASEKRAYLLSDRGTWLAYRGRLDLEILVEGDPRLHNPYGVILVNPAKHPEVKKEAARKLLDYLVSEEGQKRIGEYRKDGEVLFHPASGG